MAFLLLEDGWPEARQPRTPYARSPGPYLYKRHFWVKTVITDGPEETNYTNKNVRLPQPAA